MKRIRIGNTGYAGISMLWRSREKKIVLVARRRDASGAIERMERTIGSRNGGRGTQIIVEMLVWQGVERNALPQLTEKLWYIGRWLESTPSAKAYALDARDELCLSAMTHYRHHPDRG